MTWTELKRVTLTDPPAALLVGIFGIGRESAEGSAFQPLEGRACLEAGPLPPRFRRGDANADSATDISDSITILGFLFLGNPSNLDCQKSADVNGSGEIDISDAVYLLSYKFLGGQAPPEPFQACGVEPAPQDLPCNSSPLCQ